MEIYVSTNKKYYEMPTISKEIPITRNCQFLALPNFTEVFQLTIQHKIKQNRMVYRGLFNQFPISTSTQWWSIISYYQNDWKSFMVGSRSWLDQNDPESWIHWPSRSSDITPMDNSINHLNSLMRRIWLLHCGAKFIDTKRELLLDKFR